MMIKLFLDIDGVIINSIKAYCHAYNELYKNEKGFIEAIWWKTELWNIQDQCTLIDNTDVIFSNDKFFEYAEFMNDNTYQVIQLLSKKYDIILCSIGTYKNIHLKSLWIEQHLPFINKSVLLVNNKDKIGKSIINMQDSIFIDDVAFNLETCNAKYKIIFGDEYNWNKNYSGERCYNWTDVHNYLR